MPELNDRIGIYQLSPTGQLMAWPEPVTGSPTLDNTGLRLWADELQGVETQDADSTFVGGAGGSQGTRTTEREMRRYRVRAHPRLNEIDLSGHWSLRASDQWAGELRGVVRDGRFFQLEAAGDNAVRVVG